MKWVLRVEYRRKNEKGEYEYYKVDFDYNGCTDKMKTRWLTDAENVAFGNCKPNEDVMRYELVQVEEKSVTEQYTLLIMEENKVVKMKVFITMKDLLNYKRYYDEDLKNVELKQVDKYGYVWFYEFE